MNEGVQFTHLYNKGLRFKQIAKEMNISISKAKKLRSKLGLPKRYSSLHPYRKLQVERVIELYKEGNSTLIISKKLSLNPESVRKILIKNKIERRNTNGLSLPKVTKQNKLICDMYITGKPVKKICNKAEISKRAVFKRLKKMGISRNRKPHHEIGKIYDNTIKAEYTTGKSINDISRKLEVTKSFVTYRLSQIFPDGTEYRLFYFSNLTNKWKKMQKVPTRIDLDKQRKRLKMRLGYSPKVRIKAINIFNPRGV
jgi:hypothetical protein